MPVEMTKEEWNSIAVNIEDKVLKRTLKKIINGKPLTSKDRNDICLRVTLCRLCPIRHDCKAWNDI